MNVKKTAFYIEPFAPAGLFLLFFSWDALLRGAVVVSVLAHELAHLAAVKLCGGRTQSVRVTAFGISLVFSAPKSYGEEIFTAAAGPLASFALAALGFFRGGAFGAQVCLFSCFLGVLNLLPLPSFDGSRVAGGVLALLFGADAAERAMRVLSMLCLFCAWVLAVYVLFYSGANFTLLLFCAYIFAAAVIKKDCNSRNKVIQ